MSTAAYADLVETLTAELLAQTARANRYEAALRQISAEVEPHDGGDPIAVARIVRDALAYEASA